MKFYTEMQPMETAPKNTRILVRFKEHCNVHPKEGFPLQRIMIGWWCDDAPFDDDDCEGWWPLPGDDHLLEKQKV